MKDVPALYRSSSDRYTTRNGLLYYTAVTGDTPRVIIPTHNDLRLRIMYECHDAPTSGHRGREKTYLTISRNFYWPRRYQFVRKYIRACEVCQRVKPSPSARAPLHSNLYHFRQSVGSPYIWTSSSDFPKTITKTIEFLFCRQIQQDGTSCCSSRVHNGSGLRPFVYRHGVQTPWFAE